MAIRNDPCDTAESALREVGLPTRLFKGTIQVLTGSAVCRTAQCCSVPADLYRIQECGSTIMAKVLGHLNPSSSTEHERGKVLGVLRETDHLLLEPHRNLVQCLGWATTQDYSKLVLLTEELSVSLECLLKQLPTSPVNGPINLMEMGKKYIRDIARAFEFLHRRAIYHGHFTPSNVLIDHHGHCAKVSDPGLRLALQRALIQPHSVNLATQACEYSAPEIRGRIPSAENLKPCDIYSLGKVSLAILSYLSGDLHSKSPPAQGGLSLLPASDPPPVQIKGTLEACINSDPRRRPPAGEVLEDASNWATDVRTPKPERHMLPQPLRTAAATVGPSPILSPSERDECLANNKWMALASPCPNATNLRYATLFKGKLYVAQRNPAWVYRTGNVRDTSPPEFLTPHLQSELPKLEDALLIGIVSDSKHCYIIVHTKKVKPPPKPRIYCLDESTSSFEAVVNNESPHAQPYCAVSMLHGKLYFFGGRLDGAESKRVSCYDPVTGQWLTSPAELPELPKCSRCSQAVLLSEDELIVGGGYQPDASGNMQPSHVLRHGSECSNVRWLEDHGIPAAPCRAGLCVYRNFLFQIGGHGPSIVREEFTTTCTAYYLGDSPRDQGRPNAISLPDLPDTVYGSAVLVYCGALLVIGGGCGSLNYRSAIYAYPVDDFGPAGKVALTVGSRS